MKRRIFVAAALLALVGVSSTAWSYDEALASRYAQLFAPATGAQTGKALHLMKAEELVAKLNAGERVLTLDVRTPAEAAVFTSAVPGGLAIPIDQLFKPENLARIPADRPVVVLCKSGTRAMAAGTALRHVGFDNVFVLEGGFQGLTVYLDAKTANPAPKTAAAH